MLATILFLLLPSDARAQAPDPNPGRITLTGGIDFTNAYMFRGLRQDDTGLIMWPFGDVGIDVFDGSGGLQNATINFGIWNSLHTGDTGTDGPSRKLWYESDFYTSLTLGLDGGYSVGATYTAYTSPNGAFSTVKEIAFRVAADDTSSYTGISLRPYALVAFELDTAPRLGQADGGEDAGRYLEVGIAPGWTNEWATIAFPIKTGLSLANYYELAGDDHPFGFFSVAATASVPLGGTTDYGAWSLRGAIEFQSLGDTPEAFNLGDQSKVIGSIGIAFSY